MVGLLDTGTLNHLLTTFGYAAVLLFIAVESLGVPFPGETMLILAALYAGSTHRLSIALVILAASAGAIAGDNVGFAIGRWGGYRLLRRYGRRVRLDETALKVGRLLFVRHGGKVVFFGRFVSVLRTYAAFLAGTNRMEWGRFLAFNAAGGVLWSTFYGLWPYFLGGTAERLSRPVDVGFGAVGAVAVLTFLVLLRRHKARLSEEAERVMPGPLDDHVGPPARGLRAGGEPTAARPVAGAAVAGPGRRPAGGPARPEEASGG